VLEISIQEVSDRLNLDNPWWLLEDVLPHFATMPERDYFPGFYALVTNRAVQRATILMGPRRVGKTVMIQQAVRRLIRDGVPPRKILYVSVDTPTFTGQSLERLVRLFLERNGLAPTDESYVFFDEIQYLREWEIHLKDLVDAYRAIRFTASGSAAAALRLKSAESGAGRFTDYTLPPLTFAEYLKFTGQERELIAEPRMDAGNMKYQARDIVELNRQFVAYINHGGYPEAVMSEDIRRNAAQYLRRDIIDKVLLRDLPSLYGISDIQELNRLFTTLAYHSGREISLEELSHSSNVEKNTIKRYLEYLEAAFLIFRVRRLDDAGRHFKRQRNFKVYLTNPSMRGALFNPVNVEDEAMGPLAETAVFSQWFHSESMRSLHYARWKDGEVDMVMLNQEKPSWAVEVKWTDRFAERPGELTGLLSFARKTSLEEVLVTTRTKKAKVRVQERVIEFEPCALYCYGLGKNILRDKSS